MNDYLLKAEAAADQVWRMLDEHLEHIERIAASGMVATEEDVLRVKMMAAAVAGELHLRRARCDSEV